MAGLPDNRRWWPDHRLAYVRDGAGRVRYLRGDPAMSTGPVTCSPGHRNGWGTATQVRCGQRGGIAANYSTDGAEAGIALTTVSAQRETIRLCRCRT